MTTAIKAFKEFSMTGSTTIGHFIHGEHAVGGHRSADVFNPATGTPEKKVLLADKTTVEQAIASSAKAYPAWLNTPPLKRAAS
jgi:malonate-semialdehyde dehydrogenase (acetylating)/methylmalonate-semialdehyde dehydrogenase